MKIPGSHPRYRSLIVREKLIEYFDKGIVAKAGLIAQGRGECFDYLIGEKTTDMAKRAIEASVALILISKKPVISVNGNVAALVPESVVKLSKITGAMIEINLFYRTRTREKKIYEILKKYGADDILGIEEEKETIPKLESERRKVSKKGIFIADTVFVPLEDGDRTETLIKLNKKVITVDLNPLSRTSQNANITIVDNIVRAMPLMVKMSAVMKGYSFEKLRNIVENYDNEKNLKDIVFYVVERFSFQK